MFYLGWQANILGKFHDLGSTGEYNNHRGSDSVPTLQTSNSDTHVLVCQVSLSALDSKIVNIWFCSVVSSNILA